MRKFIFNFLLGFLIAAAIFLFIKPNNPSVPDPQIIINPSPAQEDHASAIISQNISGTLQGQTTIPILINHPTQEIKIPVKGNLEVEFFNKRNGKKLGSDCPELSGETIIKWLSNNQIEAITTFNSRLKFAINIPKEKKLWHVGMMIASDRNWFYIQRDFPWNDYISGNLRVEDKRISAGIEFNF